MKDQHTKIKGYRDLSQEEIDLMNEIKAHGEATKALLAKVSSMRNNEVIGAAALSAEQFAESNRALALAKTQLQQGQMWFVRAVALPDSF